MQTEAKGKTRRKPRAGPEALKRRAPTSSDSSVVRRFLLVHMWLPNTHLEKEADEHAPRNLQPNCFPLAQRL